jgi:hypothetical protein
MHFQNIDVRGWCLLRTAAANATESCLLADILRILKTVDGVVGTKSSGTVGRSRECLPNDLCPSLSVRLLQDDSVDIVVGIGNRQTEDSQAESEERDVHCESKLFDVPMSVSALMALQRLRGERQIYMLGQVIAYVYTLHLDSAP